MSTSATMRLFDEISDPELVVMREELIIDEFSDGEIAVKPEKSVRGAYVYLFAANSRGHVEELVMTLDSLQRSSVKAVTLILPYFGYGRQDKRKNTRGSLGAKVMANIIQSFRVVERVVTLDIHADQVRGFFDIPVENVEGHAVFAQHLKQVVTQNMVITPPDSGGSERARQMAHKLNLPLVQLDKHREKANEVASMILIGDVTNKDVLIIDDMGDTLGTMLKAVQVLKAKGANKVHVCFTHPVLSGEAMDRLDLIRKHGEGSIFMSDTIDHGVDMANWDVKIISCVPVMERVIKNLIEDGSISSINN